MMQKRSKDILPSLLDALPSAIIPDDVDLASIASSFADSLARLSASDFAEVAVWRDCFALTGTLRTLYSPRTVSEVYRNRCLARRARSFFLQADEASIVRISSSCSWINVPFRFETNASPAACCSGVLSLIPSGENGEYTIWMLQTLLDRFREYPSLDKLDTTTQSPSVGDSTTDFDCLIVGAGHSGLNVAGRLKALGVSYLVIDKNPRVGDDWRLRYDSAKLHTIRDYSHLPFERNFAHIDHEWLTKDDLAEGFASWAEKYRINIWTSSDLQSGTWDDSRTQWTLKVRQTIAGSKIIKIVTCRHVVLATGGPCNKPHKPFYPGEERFKGVVQHSVSYRNAWDWKGRRGVVVGTANTAHDIAEDMLDAGLASVTMVQRSRTYVLPQEYLTKVWKQILNDHTPLETSGRILFAGPLAVSRLTTMAALNTQAEAEPERFAALERACFRTERYGDIISLLGERFGGHYIDVGASAKIAQGLIKVKSDSRVVSYTEDGLIFEDGTHLPADVVVYATGFTGNLRDSVREYFGDEIYAQVEEYWGINQEGEIKGAYVPTGHPGLWYVGGGMGQARFFAPFVALQILAHLLGNPLPVYSETPVVEGG
ncbi:flavin-containing monooxygenase [Aspergillus novofumigatus IBT 16806]|uniref:Putative flavin-containing monooxygenase n=1 Tax=Aspergillus novofumigatus (strain IBT 16806) TaxID=1392255 RepID=A0A2I1BYU3_ASPN1|nr:putative flavin-containing monooxygenase [Aspergillus novofumigatus IBT 16806]PKX90546.1 putative flavin-containing monooxygenase [Aspergillus novofumigatus IBT 16806]